MTPHLNAYKRDFKRHLIYGMTSQPIIIALKCYYT